MRSILLGVLAGLALATPARADGAWTSYLRPFTYTDLLAEGDTVWCATLEAGLLQFDRVSGAFRSVTREPGGLASNALTTLARDRSGRLWVGTQGRGVSRLSAGGAAWDLLNRFDGLPSDSVTTLTVVGDTVWIGTTGGIALWDGRQVAGALPDGVNPSPFTNDWITGIVQQGDSLWVATRDGIWVSRLSTGLATWAAVNDNLGVRPWRSLGSDGVGLFGQTEDTGIFRRSFTASGWSSVAGGLGTLHRFTADAGALLISTASGLHRWNGSGWTLLNGDLTDGPGARDIHAIAVDEAGRYAAGNRMGLSVGPAGGALPWPRLAPPAPPGNDIINLNLQGGRVYVSTEVDGLGRFDGTSWRLWPPTPCGGCDTTFLVPVFSYPLEVDAQERKWFGMWGVAVEVLDDSVDPPQVIHNQYGGTRMPTKLWASARDSLHDGMWFGGDTDCLGCQNYTPIGLYYYNRLGLDSLNLRQDSLPQIRGTKVHGLTVDRGGRVWVGYTGEGIQYFDWPAPGGAFNFNTVSASENFDVQALVAHGDSIYAMTTRDVRIYNRYTAAFRDSFLLPSVPARLPLNPLAIGRDGTVYVGSTAGLRARRRDGSIVDYDISNSPIAGNSVQAVRVDPASGALWIGTQSGLSRFDPAYTPPPPPPPPDQLAVSVYPNPVATSGMGIALRIHGNGGAYEGVVLDLSGREVHRFRGAGNQGVIWDGRHQGGHRVRPGIYFVRVVSGGKSATRRVVVVH